MDCTTRQTIQRAASDNAGSQVFRVSITKVLSVIHKWIIANPGQSAFITTNSFLVFTPAALTGPMLAAMGFGASGPVAGEWS